jgi:hypothetical protein
VGDERTIRVVFERKREPSGCATAVLVVLAIGLAVEYWYVTVGLIGFALIMVVVLAQLEKKKLPRNRGPHDPWLNEVAVSLADLDLTEIGRNTGSQVGGTPIEADIVFADKRITIYAHLFKTDALARQAELALRAEPKVRKAIQKGRTAIAQDGRLLYLAKAKSKVVDEFRLREAMEAVRAIPLPPPLPAAPRPAAVTPSGQPKTSVKNGPPDSADLADLSADALEQLRRLGELKERGLLTEEEFARKKAELLRRI